MKRSLYVSALLLITLFVIFVSIIVLGGLKTGKVYDPLTGEALSGVKIQ